MTVPPEVARVARELRTKRRTRSGRRDIPWQQIADEIERQGLGRYRPDELAAAVADLPIEEHPLAPPSDAARAQLEAGFRQGWAEEFPGEPWPGLDEAQRRLREKAMGGNTPR